MYMLSIMVALFLVTLVGLIIQGNSNYLNLSLEIEKYSSVYGISSSPNFGPYKE